MLARAIPTILPDLTFEEAMEITRIHSVAGKLKDNKLVESRPFIAPHHSASEASLIGGGAGARLGEISMAHLGVLFLDEMPEFERNVLEALRQPLEDGMINVSRVNAKANYPARFMLIGAMNPCPCGNYGSKTRQCTCGIHRVQHYRDRLSGPLLDRIDIFVTMNEITYDDLHVTKPKNIESSEDVRARVNACRAIQQARFTGTGIYCNAHMTQKEIEAFCVLDEQAQRLYQHEFTSRGFNGRANARTLKIARTIADLDNCPQINSEHIAEAIQFRSVDKE